MFASPVEGGVHECFAYALALVCGVDIPAFDVEDWGGHAFFGGGADGEFDEANRIVILVECEEALEGLGFECALGEDLAGLFLEEFGVLVVEKGIAHGVQGGEVLFGVGGDFHDVVGWLKDTDCQGWVDLEKLITSRYLNLNQPCWI